MRMDRRLSVLEDKIVPPHTGHVILCGKGYLDEPEEVWEARREAALSAYGRDRVKPGELLIAVRFIYPGDWPGAPDVVTSS